MPRQDIAARLAALCADLRQHARELDPPTLQREFAAQVWLIDNDVSAVDKRWFAEEVQRAVEQLVRAAPGAERC